MNDNKVPSSNPILELIAVLLCLLMIVGFFLKIVLF